MRKDPVFRGCTRPAMFLGVPYGPFTILFMATLLLTFYINMFCLVLLPPGILVMRHMARRDEQVFRLIAQHLKFRTKVRQVSRNDGVWVWSPNTARSADRRAPAPLILHRR